MADHASNRAAAVLLSHIQWRQGLDRIGELGLPYEVHSIDVSRGETRTPQFLTLNPNGKIPAIIDPEGPDGTPIALFESGAILLYLAEKTGKLLPPSAARALTRLSSGILSDVGCRADVWTSRVLPQVRRPRD